MLLSVDGDLDHDLPVLGSQVPPRKSQEGSLFHDWVPFLGGKRHLELSPLELHSRFGDKPF